MHSGECAFSSLCKTIELTKTVKKSIFILKCAAAHRNREAKKQNVQLEALRWRNIGNSTRLESY